MNLHRQVGYIDADGKIHDFDPTSEGDIVGSLVEDPMHKKGLYASWADIAFPPQSNQQSSCGC